VKPSARPNLTVVPALRPRVAGTATFSLVIVGILVFGMVVLLFLNTTLAQGAFQIHELTKAQRALNVTQQELAQKVAVAESPEELEARAVALGMVPSDNPVFIRLADGKVLGTPIPAARPPRVATGASTSNPASVATAAKDPSKAVVSP
jgi:hypothetical protein